MKPTGPLKNFDVLLYRNYGWLGAAIGWAEYDGHPGARQYSHVALVYDLAKGVACEMNPPCFHLFPLAEVPWDRVDVLRANVDSEDVFGNSFAISAARARAGKFLGPPAYSYDYSFIGKCLGVDLLARIGLTGLASSIMRHAQPEVHSAVCSNTAEAILEAGLYIEYPHVEFRPGYLGEDEMRPSDYPLSPVLEAVS